MLQELEYLLCVDVLLVAPHLHLPNIGFLYSTTQDQVQAKSNHLDRSLGHKLFVVKTNSQQLIHFLLLEPQELLDLLPAALCCTNLSHAKQVSKIQDPLIQSHKQSIHQSKNLRHHWQIHPLIEILQTGITRPLLPSQANHTSDMGKLP